MSTPVVSVVPRAEIQFSCRQGRRARQPSERRRMGRRRSVAPAWRTARVLGPSRRVMLLCHAGDRITPCPATERAAKQKFAALAAPSCTHLPSPARRAAVIAAATAGNSEMNTAGRCLRRKAREWRARAKAGSRAWWMWARPSGPCRKAAWEARPPAACRPATGSSAPTCLSARRGRRCGSHHHRSAAAGSPTPAHTVAWRTGRRRARSARAFARFHT
mmetsp:Transcript_46595/g.109839  ORF Transcript_46595/g.109839 Transcript_46595/m.109839 type:complete len:218 (-) Transcript_46595:93-746(-)